MDTHTVGSGKLLGYDVQSRAAFTAHMRPDGSWVGHAYDGVVICAEVLPHISVMELET